MGFDGTNHLVVWEDDANSPNNDVYGQFISSAGQLAGGQLPLCTQTENQYSPSVCFGRTHYLVAWPSRRRGSPELYDIEGCLVSRSGTPGGIVRISQTASPSYNPASLAFDGTNFTVVWNRDIGPGDPSPTEWDVYGRLVSEAGSPLGNELAMATGAGSQTLPTIGFDGLNYLVSWHDELEMNTKFRFFRPSGLPVGEEFHVFAPVGLQVPLGLITCFDGNRFLAIADLNEDWSRVPYGDVWGAFIPKSAPVELTVTPNLVTNDYVGKVTLTITGLSPGETVRIGQHADLNHNGAFDPGEPLLQAFGAPET